MKFFLFKDEFRFPDGTLNMKVRQISDGAWITLNGFSFEELLIKHDCIRSSGFTGKINLFAPYLPARQDRVCNDGEPFTARLVARTINQLGFDKVLTIEPHSNVISGMIERLKVLSYGDVFDFKKIGILNQHSRLNLVAPDAGATKRTEDFAKSVLKVFPQKEIRLIQGIKKRNLLTGEILEIKLSERMDLEGEDVLVVDDVCAMGGTFSGLFSVLKDANAGNVDLILAHADKKNGLDRLSRQYLNIYVTNSQPIEVSHLENIHVHNVYREDYDV